MLDQLSLYLISVARLFRKGEAICREDFVRRIDEEPSAPPSVKRFFHQLTFDEAVVDDRGFISLDNSTRETYSDA